MNALPPPPGMPGGGNWLATVPDDLRQLLTDFMGTSDIVQPQASIHQGRDLPRVGLRPRQPGPTQAMAKVELTRHLFAYFPQLEGRELVVDAATVADVVRGMEAIAPGFAFYVCDERGRLRTHVNIFIGEDRVADRKRLTDTVEEDSRVFIFQALSGG